MALRENHGSDGFGEFGSPQWSEEDREIGRKWAKIWAEQKAQEEKKIAQRIALRNAGKPIPKHLRD